MQRLQAFKFELMPDGNQERDMRRFAGSCRFVFNKALAFQTANHETGNKFISYVEMANLLPAWKSEFEWLKESPSQALQHSLKNLDRAFINFFEKRTKYPRFKKRGLGDSFRFPQGFKLDQANDRIFLPKLGWVRYRNSREVLGTVRNVTVSASNGKWFISIQTVREIEQPVAQGAAVGIDMGIVRFATLSDGTVYPPLNIFKRYAADLRKAQQTMSRKKKFSNNWKKAKAHPCSHCQRSSGLPAQSLYHHQQKPRDGRRRRLAGKQYVPVCCWHCRTTRQERPRQSRSQQVDTRPGLGGIPAATGVQNALGGRPIPGRATAEHFPDVPTLWPCLRRKPQDTGRICLRRMWLCGER
jgi:hypothetical protein